MRDSRTAPVPHDYSHLPERRKELCQQTPQALKPLSTPACRALQKRKPQSRETFIVFAQHKRRVHAGVHTGALCGEPVRVGKGKTVTRPPAPGQRYLELTWKKRQRFLGPETISASALRAGSGEVSLSYVFLPQTQSLLSEL